MLNKRHDLDSAVEETMMCVVATGYNIFTKGKIDLFFRSLHSQNYTNFQLFYVDDNSPDDTSLRAFASVTDNFPAIKDRVFFLRNSKNIGALANRDSTIKEHCPPGSIVIHMDADDFLLGRQVFNTLNRVYQQ